MTVVDYGCGPARYVRKASKLAGASGKVYAADLHPLAMEAVGKKVGRHGLKNVMPILVKAFPCPVPDDSADVIYALDMFHMVKDPSALLAEFKRMIKPDGSLYLEDGHQAREKTLSKVRTAGGWEITEETKGYLKMAPKG